MSGVPAYSIFGAVSSVLVTAAILFVFYRALTGHRFLAGLYNATVAFEGVFLVSYMAYDAVVHPAAANPDLPTWMLVVSGVHGLLSLVVFVALVYVAVAAHRRGRFGRNYLRDHAGLTWALGVLAILSLLSGELIFVYLHVI